jgi:hypothetical protein
VAAGSSGPPTLEQLAFKASEAYAHCGFDADASMGPLLMLANMETRVEVGSPLPGRLGLAAWPLPGL